MMGLWLLALFPLALASQYPGPAEEYYDITKIGEKDWRFVFRGQAHVQKSIYQAYVDGSNIGTVPDNCKKADWSLPCDNHYRNDDALDKWTNIKEVLVGVVHEGALVRTIVFNGAKTDKMSFFKQSNLNRSCYSDIMDQPKNYFSIEGHADSGTDKVYRRFFINRNYNGCENDAGWLVAIDGVDAQRTCTWEKGELYPVIKYSAGHTYTHWTNGTVINADALVIFVRYHPSRGDYSQYHDIFGSGKKEYRLAFRGTAGAGTSMYAAYKDGAGLPSTVNPDCLSSDFTLNCSSHYRNDEALNVWTDVEEVVFGIVDDKALVKTIKFSGENTTYMDWFLQRNLKDSCYSDLMTERKNYFSIEGHTEDTRVARHFFINRLYHDCPGDEGWVVAIDNDVEPCPWENLLPGDSIPKLMYSGSQRAENWTTGDRRVADAYVIFLKYREY